MQIIMLPAIKKLLLFFSLVVILVLSVLGLTSLTFDQQAGKKINQELSSITTSTIEIQQILGEAGQDLKMISTSSELRKFLNHPEGENYSDLAKMFSDFVDSRQYLQFRLIDRDGFEVLRVELQDGHSAIVTQGRLQNKQGRYYFTETMQLTEGQIYYSPIDFNVEDGKVESPFHPVMRVAMAIRYESNEASGIIVINLDARSLARQLDN